MRRLGLLCAFLLVVAGCGEGGDGPDSADGGGVTTSTVAAAGYVSEVYADPAHWVCRPDVDDVCDTGMDATVVAADGTLAVEPFVAAADPPVDCFYVYPTVSQDPGLNSDLEPGDAEEGRAAQSQVARLGTQCRVFAPVYRQVTLAGLLGSAGGDRNAAFETAYADVADAWAHYLANDNEGRGVVLVGHSQGSGMLNRLIAEELEADPAQLDLLVGAYLAGSAVAVPDGGAVGGDFATVPVCDEAGQVGCVMSWAAFRATAPPPPTSFFGAPRDGEGVAACTNPADLGGAEAELDAYFPTAGQAWVDPAVGEVATPFVRVPGLVSGRCVERDGFHVLEVTVADDPADPRADDIVGDLSPEWGLHLVDLNLVMGDVGARVADQVEAYLS